MGIGDKYVHLTSSQTKKGLFISCQFEFRDQLKCVLKCSIKMALTFEFRAVKGIKAVVIVTNYSQGIKLLHKLFCSHKFNISIL